MPIIRYQCENCESLFSVKYSEEQCETDPAFCPFCAEPLFYNEDLEDEDV